MSVVAVWLRTPVDTRLRIRILIAFTAFFPTYAIARLAQHPGSRPRPMVDRALKILGDPAAFHQIKDELSRWGSFPSDHSALLASQR
jgi:membrane-associated phospholipid phosphatase